MRRINLGILPSSFLICLSAAPVNQPPVVVSVTPNFAIGMAVKVRIDVSDVDGGAKVRAVHLLISTSPERRAES